MKLLEFFRNEKPNAHGKMFIEIISYNDDQFEKNHNFIQWMFPTDTRSKFNWRAPILTAQDVVDINNDSLAMEYIHIGTKRFLNFLGYELDGLQIRKSENHLSRTKMWITKNNHNYKRISRFLRFCKMMGGDLYKIGQHFLLSHLVRLWETNRDVIGDNTLLYWSSSLGINVPSVKK